MAQQALVNLDVDGGILYIHETDEPVPSNSHSSSSDASGLKERQQASVHG
jgi:hypothetical protein